MTFSPKILIAIAICTASAGPAAASVLTFDFAGTMKGSTDYDGVFLGKGESFKGYRFQLEETFDLDKSLPDSLGRHAVFNGARAALTINGVTKTIGGSLAFFTKSAGHFSSSVSIFRLHMSGTSEISIDATSSRIPGDFQSFSVGGPGDGISGSFAQGGFFATISGKLTGGTFGPSPVPLPASAPLFGAAVLALGLTGYGSRRTKAAAGN